MLSARVPGLRICPDSYIPSGEGARVLSTAATGGEPDKPNARGYLDTVGIAVSKLLIFNNGCVNG